METMYADCVRRNPLTYLLGLGLDVKPTHVHARTAEPRGGEIVFAEKHGKMTCLKHANIISVQ
jgi:hypothetical protein